MGTAFAEFFAAATCRHPRHPATPVPAMPPRLSWSKLLPGLIALTAVIMVALGVLVFAGVGKLRGETMRLYVLADQARGLMGGSEVWLAGQKIGVVEEIGFANGVVWSEQTILGFLPPPPIVLTGSAGAPVWTGSPLATASCDSANRSIWAPASFT